MNKKLGMFLFALLALTVVAVPVFGQGAVDMCNLVYDSYGPSLQYTLCRIAFLINSIIPVLIALAVVYFIWGIIQYVIAKTDEAKTAGRDKMIWGLIGLLVIVAVWGLVAMLRNSFGIATTSTIDVPCIAGGIGVGCDTDGNGEADVMQPPPPPPVGSIT